MGVGLFMKPRKRIINIDTYSHTMGRGFDSDERTDNLCRSLQRAKQSRGLLLKFVGTVLILSQVNI